MDTPPARTLRYGPNGPVYGFEQTTMLEVLGALAAEVGGAPPAADGIRIETHRYFDDAMETNYVCSVGEEAVVTTQTMTNCGLPYLEFVVHSRNPAVVEAIERWLNLEMSRRLPRVTPPPPPVAPEPQVYAPLSVAEPPDARLTPGEQAIIDLIVAGKSHHDADKEGGFRDFVSRDGQFVQLYGSHADATRGEMVYAGPKAFVRDLLATCHYERAHAATDVDFYEVVRRAIAAR